VTTETPSGDKSSGSRPRKAAGPDRPAYFDHADIDRVMAVLLALIAEVASIRERLDTHERVAAEGSAPTPALVESYAADPATEEAREAWRDAYIRRLFRVITEDIDALQARGSTP
jgi:hypothetical protein